MDETTPEATYDLRAIIVTAFAMARAKGKSDWRRMNGAVLKNRLLQITDGKFNEAHHNASSIRELLEGLSDLVQEVDGQWELLPKHTPSVTRPGVKLGSSARIRPDLWSAVMDFSKAGQFAWDAASQRRVQRAHEGDPPLPTASREDMHAWRSEFVQQQPDPASLKKWLDDGLASRELPSAQAAEWNAFLKRRVAERLETWFHEHGLPMPELFSPVHPPSLPRSSEPDVESDATALRELLHACIDVMTTDELGEQRLSPSLILRARIAWRRA